MVKEYQVTPPTITFSDELNLYLGGHTFRLLHLPGHTLGQIGVYVPEERVVFTGDNFGNGFQPWLHECYPLEWLDSLERILNLDVEFVVPGHGEVGDKEAVRSFKTFLEQCIGTVREAIEKGMSRKDAVDTIQFEDLLPTRHPGRETQRMNVARLYEMLLRDTGRQ
jgi:cyclase